jgi:hypothetical protein
MAGEPNQQKKGLFARPPAPEAVAAGPDFGSLTTRLRLVEEKTSNLNRKIELLENNLVSFTRKTQQDLQTLDGEFLDIKHAVNQMNQKMDIIVRELKMAAGKDELNTLQRYLDMWDLTRFVSRGEIDALIEEKLARREKTFIKRKTVSPTHR